MNPFISKAIITIKNQTGCSDIECKKALDRTHSIKEAIDFLRWLHYKKSRYSGQMY